VEEGEAMRTRWMAVVLVAVVVVLYLWVGDYFTGWHVVGRIEAEVVDQGVAVVVVLYLWVGDYFTGWHVVGRIEAEVVDQGTGRAIEGARIWRSGEIPALGLIKGTWGGAAEGKELCWREGREGGGGRYEVPGYVGVEPLEAVTLFVYRPGWEAVWVMVWPYGGMHVEGDGAVGWERGLRRSWVRIGMRKLDVGDARGWEEHLRLLETRRARYSEKPRDCVHGIPRDLVLDEAYRYVSQGGELTEGILRALDFWLPAGPPLDGPWRDRRMQVVGEAVLE